VSWQILTPILLILGFAYMFWFYKKPPAPVGAVWRLAKSLNVKPEFIMEMIGNMGKSRGQIFIQTLSNVETESLELGAQTFFVYQTYSKNRHPENIRWWTKKMVARGFQVALSTKSCEAISVFLNEIGVDQISLMDFRKEIAAANS